MSMIHIEKLHFCYPESSEPVFTDLNLHLDSSWKLGLIGRNGRGKTTLMRLLAGELPFEGRIASQVNFARFPMNIANPSRRAGEVMREICPQAEDWEIQCELSHLELDEELLDLPFDRLSGGERTKLMLAAMFLREDSFPLIDEPTNHLDDAGRALVAAYLRRKRGFILAAHDRAFLDGCTDHILAINRSGIELQSGNYSSWRLNFERREAFERAEDARLRQDIRQLRDASRRAANWSDRVESTKHGQRNAGLRPDRGFIGHKSAKMMQRAKSIEQRRDRAIEEKSLLLKDVEKAESLKLSPLRHPANRLVELRDVRIQYGARSVCGPLRLSVESGERIALSGGNGCGKSSLIHLILGEDIPHSSDVQRASGLIVSHVPQESGHLRGRLSDFARARGVDATLMLSILRKMGFTREQFEIDLSSYSEGQKKKALIAASLCQRAHLYIWDEPLNYIDIDSRLQIEELILKFEPTLIFVEHDRAFREAVATRSIRLD